MQNAQVLVIAEARATSAVDPDLEAHAASGMMVSVSSE